jgi:hypothetical protein
MGNNSGMKPPIGPVFARLGPTAGSIAAPGPAPATLPRSEELSPGIKPLSGGALDARRIRTIKGYFTSLAPEMVIFEDQTREVSYDATLNQRLQVFTYNVPQNRTLVIDNVYFFATSLFGGGFVPPGLVEGSVQCFFDIGQAVPVDIGTDRVQLGVDQAVRAYFPFLNERVGARESTFGMYVKSGRQVGAYYTNLAFPFVPLATIGVRFEGWFLDSNIFEEILAQQR